MANQNKPGDVIAVLCSDLHLSHTKPPCRAEDDWYAVMARYLRQLKGVAEKHDVPIICAGDVFDKWLSPPELINFAIAHLPIMYAIPGQHDLPNHNYQEIERSAYWTLVRTGNLKPLIPGTTLLPHDSPQLAISAFPWGFDIGPTKDPEPTKHVQLAVVHKYIWIKGKSYPDAPATQRLRAYEEQLTGYDAAVFGDNHLSFLTTCGECNVLNNGGFIRRKSDEIEYEPSIGLLYSDGKIEQCFLNTAKDKFVTKSEVLAAERTEGRFDDFIRELGTKRDSLDYVAFVKRYLGANETSDDVTKILLESIGESNAKSG